MLNGTLKDGNGQSSFGRFSGFIIIVWTLFAASYAIYKDSTTPFIEYDAAGQIVRQVPPKFDWPGYKELFEASTWFAATMYGISKGFETVKAVKGNGNGNGNGSAPSKPQA